MNDYEMVLEPSIPEEEPTETVEETTEEVPTNEVDDTPEQEEAVAEEPNASEGEEVIDEGTDSELYELPDGRKVSGEELHKEYTQNLLPDYTRKSQELAEYKRLNNPDADKEVKEEWVPSSYEEIVERAKQEIKQEQQLEAEQKIEQQKQVEQEVNTAIESLKKSNPNLNENELFDHALKYGFSNLEMAYQNLQAFKQQTSSVKKRAVENVKKRASIPVSTEPSASNVPTPQPSASQHDSAVSYLKSLKNN